LLKLFLKKFKSIMPYTIRKNNNKNTYKVVIKDTGKVVAYATKDPKKLIQAIEINKRLRNTF
jgi:hypothetical protein